jgi:tetratricopeptide (TPR) repeat protein
LNVRSVFRRAYLIGVLAFLGLGATTEARADWKADLQAGRTALANGRYSQAETQLAGALKEVDKLQPSGRAVATLLVQLGDAQRHQTRIKEALASYKRAVAIGKTQDGGMPRETARALTGVGALYLLRADYAKAEDLHRKALALLEAKLGADHPDRTFVLYNLASVELARGKHAEARELAEAALSVSRRARGAGHVETLILEAGLGTSYLVEGNLERATEHLKTALAGFEKGDPIHSQAAVAMNDLALAEARGGKPREALERLKKAQALAEEVLGPEHLLTGRLAGTQGLVCVMLKDAAGAFAGFELALKLEEKAVGPDHPAVAETLNSLGALHFAAGQQQQAQEKFERALKIGEKNFGTKDERLSSSLNNLGGVYLQKKDWANARTCFGRLLATRESSYGEASREVTDTLKILAMLEKSAGNPEAAAAYDERLRGLTGQATPSRDEALMKACVANMKVLSGAIEMYEMDEGGQVTAVDPELLDKLLQAKYLPQPVQCPVAGEGAYSGAPSAGGIECKVHGPMGSPHQAGP